MVLRLVVLRDSGSWFTHLIPKEGRRRLGIRVFCQFYEQSHN